MALFIERALSFLDKLIKFLVKGGHQLERIMKMIVIGSLLGLSSLSSVAATQTSWWCTASGITLTYEKEVVWGDDFDNETEATADALANCRSNLSQCLIVECKERVEE